MVAASKVAVAQEATVALGGLVLPGTALGLPGGMNIERDHHALAHRGLEQLTPMQAWAN